MAIEILVYVERGHLVPASAADAEDLDSLPKGKTLSVVVKQRRSPPHHRLYWLLLDTVVKATGRWPSAKVLHEAIKMDLGFVYPLERTDGSWTMLTKSTSFGEMDQMEFRVFFTHAVDLIFERILPGVRPTFMLRQMCHKLNIDFEDIYGQGQTAATDEPVPARGD